MKRLLPWLLALPLTGQAAPPASLPEAFQQGLDYANGTLKGSAENAARSDPATTVPGYAGTDVPETAYQSAGVGLTDEARAFVPLDPNTQWYDQSIGARPKFTLDRNTDPIFQRTDAIQSDPMALAPPITGTYSGCTAQTTPSATTYTTDFCTEWPETVSLSCQRTLDVTVTKTESCAQGSVIGAGKIGRNSADWMEAQALCDTADTSSIKVRINAYGGSGQCHGGWLSFALSPSPHGENQIAILRPHWEGGCIYMPVTEQGGCTAETCDYTFRFYSPFRAYKPKQCTIEINKGLFPYKDCNPYVLRLTFPRPRMVSVENDNWTDGCGTLRAREAAGECELAQPETCIDGPATRIISGESVTRDCWVYETRYDCLGSTTVEEPYCAELRARGCTQVDSDCKTRLLDGTCAEYEQTYQCPDATVGGEVVDCGVEVFCMDGTCVDQGYEPSQDFGLAASYLSGVAELAKDFDRTTLEAFKGTHRYCRKSALGFRNCCKLSGWGVDLGLTQCSEDERQLAEERKAGFCHYVGSYTKGKLFWKKKYASFCCFKSKLARIIQEQARPLLGIGWGDPKAPECRGLTLTELTSIDWEQMDLSEFYADVIAKTSETLPDPATLEADIKARITDYLSTAAGGGP